MTDLIKRNWNQNQGAAGTGAGEVHRSDRDGLPHGHSEVEKRAARRSWTWSRSARITQSTNRLPPLPREFTENTLTVHLIFEYQR